VYGIGTRAETMVGIIKEDQTSEHVRKQGYPWAINRETLEGRYKSIEQDKWLRILVEAVNQGYLL